MTQFPLTDRQLEILRAVIEEYIATAEPVGSETLEKKYNLGVSPATIRNEMARLTQIGMLHQPHASSGRCPTPTAIRYYVDTLMRPKDLSVAETVSVKERVWDYRSDPGKLLRQSAKALAEKTKALAFAATEEGEMYYAGAANILTMPEFFDYELTLHLLECLDQAEFWWNIIAERSDAFNILLGESLGSRQFFSQCGVVYYKFSLGPTEGAIGVVGPFRLNYPFIIPIIRYMGRLLEELGG